MEFLQLFHLPMKMGKYFICCEKCFEVIAKRNTTCARLWMDLCAIRLKRGEYVELYSLDFPELRILEKLGFVVSTDRPEKICIRIKGYSQTPDGEDLFCLKAGKHD